MQTMTLAEYIAAAKAQGVPFEHIAMKCPMCGTLQSATDLIAAGAGATVDEVEKYLGYSCVGRFTGASSPRSTPDGKPCNWTLGGLFKLHRLEVVAPDGTVHPRFELASPAEAISHMRARTVPAACEEVSG